jgi:hypothetical protein
MAVAFTARLQKGERKQRERDIVNILFDRAGSPNSQSDVSVIYKL